MVGIWILTCVPLYPKACIETKLEYLQYIPWDLTNVMPHTMYHIYVDEIFYDYQKQLVLEYAQRL